MYMGLGLSAFLYDLEGEFLRECNITWVSVMGVGLRGFEPMLWTMIKVGCPMCERGQLNWFKWGAATCVAAPLGEPGTPSSTRRRHA